MPGSPQPSLSDADRRLVNVLAAVIAQHGPDWCGDQRRCEAMLKDLMPGHAREIKLLVDAVEAGLVRDITGSRTGLPVEVRLQQWIRRLHDEMSLREDLAGWAVGLWAIALGVADAMPVVPATGRPQPHRGDPEPASGVTAPPTSGLSPAPVPTPAPSGTAARGQTSLPSPARRTGPSALVVGAIVLAGLGTIGTLAWSVSRGPLKQSKDDGREQASDFESSAANSPSALEKPPSRDGPAAPAQLPSPVRGIRLRHRLLAAPTAAPRTVGLSANGRLAAVEEHEHVDGKLQRNSGKARISLWDIDGGRRLRTLEGHDNTINFLTFAPDGSLLASGGKLADKTLRVWDVATGDRRCTGPELSWSPLDARFLGSGTDARILFVDAHAGIRELRLIGCLTSDDIGLESCTPFACGISEDGWRLLLGCFDGLRMVDLWARRLVWHVPLGREEQGRFTASASAVAMSADGRTVMAAVHECRFVENETKRADPDRPWETIRVGLSLFSADTGKKLRDFPSRGAEYPGHAVRITGLHGFDSEFAMSCDEAGRLIEWHIPSGEPVLEQRVEEAPREMAISANGSRMLLSGAETVTVWDLER